MFSYSKDDVKDEYTQDELVDFLKEGHRKGNHCFVLVYLVGCGPCNMTKPEWKKVAREYKYNDNNKGVVMVDIDQTNLDKINPVIGNYNVSGFPTILYIHKNKVIPYENSNIKNKNRTAESFREWINSYINKMKSNSFSSDSRTKSRTKSRKNNTLNFMSDFMTNNNSSKTRKSSSKHSSKSSKNTKKYRHKQIAGKWSLKYKKSINCKKPKGFSQKQYCKYGRRTK
jgi:thiol-disulfide isomerase/thioredoxin